MTRLVQTALAVATVASLVLPGGAWATSTKLLSLDQLIEQSTKVVAADVTAAQAAWNGRFLKTKVRLKVEACLSGDCEGDAEVEVETWGGQKGGLTMRVDGAPQFEVGEKVVLFLRASHGAGSVAHTVGMAQGKFVPALGGEGVLTRDTTGLNLVGALAQPREEDVDEPDAGVLDDDPDDAATRLPTPGVDSLQGLTMDRLKGRIAHILAIRRPGALVPGDRRGAQPTLRDDTLQEPPGP